MSISPICDVCEHDIDEPSALMFGPPNGEGLSQKYHLCVQCYAKGTPNILRAAILAERERCAKVAEGDNLLGLGHGIIRQEIAAAIRKEPTDD